MTNESKSKNEQVSTNPGAEKEKVKETPGQRINTEGTDELGNVRQSIPELVTIQTIVNSP